MDLAAQLAVLDDVLNACSGIPGHVTTDANAEFRFPQVGPSGEVLPDGSLSTNALARLEWKLISITDLGQAEQRNVYDPTAVIAGDTYPGALGGVVTTVTGNRILRVQVKIESFAPAHGGAFVPLERVRTRLSLPAVVDTLEAAGLAVSEIGASSPHDFQDDNGRLVSCALLELTLNAADSATDGPVTTIETTGPIDFTELP